MEQRGVVLSAIARVLNAGGAALVNVYDAVASIKTGVGPGERGRLRARLRECEYKSARLYLEIGKEVALREPTAQMSAAGEAGIELAAKYRAEMEKIRRRLKDLEEEEKAAREAAITRARKKPEPAPSAGEPAAVEAPEAEEASTDAVAEETKEIVVAVAETQAPEIDADTPASEAVEAGQAPMDVVTEEVEDIVAKADEAQTQEMAPDSAASAEPEAGNVAAGVVTEEATGMPAEAGATTEALENMLKSDLLKLCLEKGIEPDKRMAKAEIIKLLAGRL